MISSTGSLKTARWDQSLLDPKNWCGGSYWGWFGVQEIDGRSDAVSDRNDTRVR